LIQVNFLKKTFGDFFSVMPTSHKYCKWSPFYRKHIKHAPNCCMCLTTDEVCITCQHWHDDTTLSRLVFYGTYFPNWNEV